MITDYATLKTSIASFLHRSDLTDIIPEFIADGEARIYNDLRIRAMESSFSEEIASGVVAIPSSFLEWKFLYVDHNTTQKLTYKDSEWIYTNYPTRSGSGKPVFYSLEGSNVIFGPYPGTYTVKGRYYKRLTALSDANPTNWFITNEPALLRFAALCEAAPYIVNDERIALWESKYRATIDRIQTTEKRTESRGSLLTITAG